MVLELIVNVKRIPVLELFANYLINHYKFFFPFHTPIYFQILTLFSSIQLISKLPTFIFRQKKTKKQKKLQFKQSFKN